MIISVLPVIVLVLVVELIVGFGSAANQRTLLTFLVTLTAVLGLGIFVGNSGIMSFGHAAFMGIGAYCGSLLVLPITIKDQALPDLPGFIGSAHLEFIPAILITLVVVGFVGFLIGLPLSRMAPPSFAIASIAFLIIVQVVLDSATTFTRGAATLYGVPPLLSVQGALAIAVIATFVAGMFKTSRWGLQLRASRENEVASRSTGGNIERNRWLAWTVSAAIAGAAGFMLATTIGAFSPKAFGLTQTFIILSMLLVGGMTSVSGAIAGTAAITAITEFLRPYESGLSLGPLETGSLFGLSTFGLGLVILLTLYFRPSGIFGYRELNQVLPGRFLKRNHREP
ncbi:MAG: branched-chain amino acid ABC transporter permease [Thermoleophilia bacterium]|nr:branched-chain amino acid ABC transporter permease [Thermoleophilia bacterium]